MPHPDPRPYQVKHYEGFVDLMAEAKDPATPAERVLELCTESLRRLGMIGAYVTSAETAGAVMTQEESDIRSMAQKGKWARPQAV